MPRGVGLLAGRESNMPRGSAIEATNIEIQSMWPSLGMYRNAVTDASAMPRPSSPDPTSRTTSRNFKMGKSR